MPDGIAQEGARNSPPVAAAAVKSDAVRNAGALDLDTKESGSSNKNSDGHEQQNDDQSKSSGAKKDNAKQRKASKWKQMNRKKKDRQRKKLEGQEDGDENNKKKKSKMTHWKKEYDQGTVSPHEGSFADENMRKLFDVVIDGGGNEKNKKTSSAGDIDNVNGDEPADNNTISNKNDDDKIPKRKLALLVSFLGSNYSGFQINKEKRTLQAEIELGLFRAGVISERNFGHPNKYSWSNSARTDKGVHAAAQVCSLKGEMIFHNTLQGDGTEKVKEQLDAMRKRVNECLPGDVRVLDFERVTRAFCARTNRDKVRYQYMVPSYLLASQEEVRKAFSTLDGKAIDSGEVNKTMTPMEAAKIVDETIDEEVLARARNALVGYRITPERMEILRSGLKLFEGTHCFHNYTRRVGANDASANRYILSFRPLDPIVVPGGSANDGGDDDIKNRADTQWIPLQIVGQSFLLNQIRKMVSGAIDLARGAASREQIERSLKKECLMKVNVAPAQGLFLDRSYFELYNKHKVENMPKHGDSRDRDTLDWVEAEGKEVPAAGKSCCLCLSLCNRSNLTSYYLHLLTCSPTNREVQERKYHTTHRQRRGDGGKFLKVPIFPGRSVCR